MVSVIARAQFAPRVQAFMGIVQRLHLSGIEAKRLSDSYTYTNSIGYDTMFLLIYLTYFGPEDGELTIGGDTLLRKELWCSGKSWYRGPATAFGAGSALGLLKNQKVEMPGVELALVDPESLCVGDSLYAT